VGFFLLATASKPALGPTQPPIMMQTASVPPEMERESDHSPPPSAELKNVWSYTSTPPYVFMVRGLIKYRVRLHGVTRS
jgi:hypothetical protein